MNNIPLLFKLILDILGNLDFLNNLGKGFLPELFTFISQTSI